MIGNDAGFTQFRYSSPLETPADTARNVCLNDEALWDPVRLTHKKLIIAQYSMPSIMRSYGERLAIVSCTDQGPL